MLSSYIANLAIVLIVSYIINLAIKSRVEKSLNALCWLCGCVASTIAQKHNPAQPIQYTLFGISATLIAFLFVLFVKESIWAIQNLNDSRNHP